MTQSSIIQNQLKELAKELEISYRQAVFMYFAEDFLRRAGKSKKRENLALRGGLLTYAYTGMISRPFEGIELTGNDPSLMQTVGEILRGAHGSSVSISGLAALSPDAVQYTARLGDLSLPIKVIREPAETVSQDLYEIPVLFEGSPAPVIALPTVEEEVCRDLADLTWKLPLTGRVDALYDLYFWSLQFDFTVEELQPVLQTTLKRRGLTAAALDDLFALRDDPTSERRFRALVKQCAFKPDFKTAMDRVETFLRPVWQTFFAGQAMTGSWIANETRWK